MTRPSPTQTFLLRRAVTRPGKLILPLPDNLRGNIADRVLQTLLAKGFIEEVDADLGSGEPLWRRVDDGSETTLIATAEGLAAIGIRLSEAEANALASRRHMTREAAKARATAAKICLPAMRSGTKQAALIALLQRPEGASTAEISAATSWLDHTIRGAISGVLKRRLGLTVAAEKVDGRGMVYRITAEG
ncbi:DUF3489 domain-containing protein [Paracoccus sp. (in: a-proteobacteria)]|uniref:DUF3489 domain-containing protein n=1 Tax=Paracoccus sp. TaxID=267 RepID=UPI00321FBD18